VNSHARHHRSDLDSTARPRRSPVRRLRALLAVVALTVVPAGAVLISANSVAAASSVQVTYCWTYPYGGAYYTVPAGMSTFAQYWDGSRNNWATPPQQNYTLTNRNGCISMNVTPGYTWRFKIWAYSRWQSDSGSHVSSDGYLGMTRVTP
jgi:hypothetical protein